MLTYHIPADRWSKKNFTGEKLQLTRVQISWRTVSVVAMLLTDKWSLGATVIRCPSVLILRRAVEEDTLLARVVGRCLTAYPVHISLVQILSVVVSPVPDIAVVFHIRQSDPELHRVCVLAQESMLVRGQIVDDEATSLRAEHVSIVIRLWLFTEVGAVLSDLDPVRVTS